MALQYKLSGNWTDIPAAALYSTWAGTYHVEYPPPQDVAIDGTQAAQTGKPRIVINAPWMSDAGFDFWRDRFASATAETASISIEAFEPRTGSKQKWVGILRRPTYDSIGVGAADTSTIYRNVKIEIWECVTTS